MAMLIDSSVWVDFLRAKSPPQLKRYLASYILDPAASLAEPVAFEVLRHALPRELAAINDQFATLPILQTPADIWEQAADLGRRCRLKGFTADAVDLLIAVIALAHNAEVVTLDADYKQIEKIGGLRVKLLARP